jgi:hypothetical protein
VKRLVLLLAACSHPSAGSGQASAPPLANRSPAPVVDAAVADPLDVTAVLPSHGDPDGGTYVLVKGRHFLADGARNTQVYFGSRAGEVVRFASDSELIVQAPGGTPGEVVDVLVVFDPGGERKLARAFTFADKSAP